MTTRTRALIATTLIVATGLLAFTTHSSMPAAAINLTALPLTIGAWKGHDAGALDEESVRVLAADSYINRTYAARGADAAVGLYVAYYAEQRPGVSIHSPLHCLPGTGWEPLDVSTIALADTATPGEVRRMIVTKELDRALVLYWYAVHRRMIARELTSKLWLLHDSLRLHRSDAGLVRIVVPLDRDAAAIDRAQRLGLGFVRDLLPHLVHVWS